MADVFISYARDDRETAAKLGEALENQGFSVWWDPAIPPGKKWAEIIGTQLGAARCIVVLWSAISVEKRWVRKEASFAEARNKLIPAKLEDVTIPFEFADVQAADLTDWQGDDRHAGFRHLASAISEQLRKPISKHPEEDIVVATEQAKEQLADTGAKTKKLRLYHLDKESDHLDNLLSTLFTLLESENSIGNIPKQDLSVHFAVDSGRITSVPTQYFGEDENDYKRINSLIPSILRFSEAAKRALGRSDAYRSLLEVLERYESECRKPVEEINYAILYGYGIELQHCYDSVLADVVAGEVPELNADQRTPMESLLQLHGPFILASKDGRELITDAERYSRSPREEKEFQAAINELGEKIARNPDVVAADTARTLNDLREVPADAKQYERWYRLNQGAFRNFVIVAAGASVAATLAAAASTGSPLLIIAGAVASWISFEGIKKSKSYGTLTQEIGRILDSASNADLQNAGQAAGSSLMRIREFVVANKDLLRRIGGSSKEMEWLEQALNDIESDTIDLEPIEKKAAGVQQKESEEFNLKYLTEDRPDVEGKLKPVFADRITREAIFALDPGVFLVSGIVADREIPAVAEVLGDERDRTGLWLKIKRHNMAGRKFYGFKDKVSYRKWRELQDSASSEP